MAKSKTDDTVMFTESKEDIFLGNIDNIIRHANLEHDYMLDYKLIENELIKFGDVVDPKKIIDQLNNRVENTKETIDKLGRIYDGLYNLRFGTTENDRHHNTKTSQHFYKNKYRYIIRCIYLFKRLIKTFENKVISTVN